MKFSASRLDSVKPSASAWVSQAAKAAKAEGKDVIDLGLGEPDFDTPQHIIQAANQAALNGETRYPPTDGTATLKQAVVDKLKRENNLSYDNAEIIISNGAKQVLFNALMASLEDNDEVLLCAPYFGQYKDIVQILGGVPVTMRCNATDAFRLRPEVLEAAITPKTRWIMLNLPSNPAGVVYSDNELRALGEVLKKYPNILVISDEIYEHILFDNRKFSSFAAVCPELKDRILTVNGVSKAYAMTGWRIGYGAGPQELIAAMTKVQSQICSGACSIAQAAAVAALNGPQDDVKQFRDAFEDRRNLVVERISGISGLTLDPPGGAFYALVGCADLINSTTSDGKVLENDEDITAYILQEAGIAAVPGSAYELSPFFRISTAASKSVLSKAMDRLDTAISKLTLA